MPSVLPGLFKLGQELAVLRLSNVISLEHALVSKLVDFFKDTGDRKVIFSPLLGMTQMVDTSFLAQGGVLDHLWVQGTWSPTSWSCRQFS